MSKAITQQDYIIIANGSFLVQEIIRESITNKSVIALDGAANKLRKLAIKPDVILGDFDSIDVATQKYWGIQPLLAGDLPYPGKQGVTIVPARNQQETDLLKAIKYCDLRDAKSITIICALGGRLDHQENILRALRTEYKFERNILLHTEQQTVRFIKNGEVTMHGKPGDRCGIFAYPLGTVTTSGLVYDVKEFELDMGYRDSSSNSLRNTSATISVKGEALLVMPPQLASQRDFMQKTEVERLQLLLRDAQE